MKEIVAKAAMDNDTWGYCHTRGVLETREFICETTNGRGGAQITPDDIIFFNGLGDAIAKIYGALRAEARVLMPSPSYTTHTLGEIGHAHAAPALFRLKSEDNWYPDLEDLRNHIRYNPNICAIMIINPDNPTGMVYPEETLREIVQIAREYDLFIIADEVYINIVYNGEKTVHISDVIGDVPAISLKGISKEFPWPGSRCGWIEVYNGQQGRAVPQVRQPDPDRQDERGLLHHPAADRDPRDRPAPRVRRLPGPAHRQLREDEQHHLRLPQQGAGPAGQPHQRRLLHGGGLPGGAAEQPPVASPSPTPRSRNW